jgi:hypothetical protein
MAEPGTKPLPITRSNSFKPDKVLSGVSLSPDKPVKLIFFAFVAAFKPLPFGGVSLLRSSLIVFQAPQLSHFPDHFDVTAPQDWQTNLDCVRDI